MPTNGQRGLYYKNTPWLRLYWHENGKCVCWPTQHRWGYGFIGVWERGKMRSKRVHRYIYEQAYGPVPRALDVCHHCDVRNCIRLSHMFVGKRRINLYDGIAKGRMPQLSDDANKYLLEIALTPPYKR